MFRHSVTYFLTSCATMSQFFEKVKTKENNFNSFISQKTQVCQTFPAKEKQKAKAFEKLKKN